MLCPRVNQSMKWAMFHSMTDVVQKTGPDEINFKYVCVHKKFRVNRLAMFMSDESNKYF